VVYLARLRSVQLSCKAFLPNYPSLTTDLQRRIVDGVWHRSELAAAVGKPEIVIVYILHPLQGSVLDC
jgi:hypothetical protein